MKNIQKPYRSYYIFAVIALLIVLAICGRGTEPSEEVASATDATLTDATADNETTEEVRETSETEAPDPYEELLESMSLEEKVGQMFFIRVENAAGVMLGTNSARGGYTALDESMEAFLETYPPGGFCLFSDNITSPEQLDDLVTQLNASVKIAPIIAIDEEGGGVLRLASNTKFDVPYVASMGSIGRSADAGKEAEEAGNTIGTYLYDYGFTLDLAPVADVNSTGGGSIGNRSFGADPQEVADLTGAYLDGLHAQGMKGCMKHFPGLGNTPGDTHNGAVNLKKTWEELCECEIIPFEQNLDKTDAVLIAHVLLPEVTSDGLPASLSWQLITGKLRKELGYDGVVITDSLAMGAVVKRYGSAEAAILAVAAGNDLLLMPKDYEEAFNAVVDAVKSGRLKESRIDESVMRILHFKELFEEE